VTVLVAADEADAPFPVVRITLRIGLRSAHVFHAEPGPNSCGPEQE
jgi:hypothetical protein